MDNYRIIIENVMPVIDCGAFPVKRVAGDSVEVTADIFSHGVEKLLANLLYRKKGGIRWSSEAMALIDNDRWEAAFSVPEPGIYEFTIESWIDRFSQWYGNLAKWSIAGEDITGDVKEGIRLISKHCTPRGKSANERLEKIIGRLQASEGSDAVDYLGKKNVRAFLEGNWNRESLTRLEIIFEVLVDRPVASFSSWYEIFPRSQISGRKKRGTLRDCEKRIPDVKEMGFNVLYLTPVHPIGNTNRRGKNGARYAEEGDPGSPWAIGNRNGGHKAIDPSLGTMDDFTHLVEAAGKAGIEIALDIAFQCSPDHPYVKEHPDWFSHRPDGTIRYAENPPKRYYDIYPLDFDMADWKALWEELKSIFIFWIEKGVRIFRVDNPHTKPFAFWKWLIGEVKREYPDVVILSEAFTRPRVMYELSKLGFSQSYTYFTWKNYHYELIDYFTELYSLPVNEFFRPVLFTNTPDILSENLRINGKPAFMNRAFLAATLSPSWGIYSGYELIENAGIEGSEEYLNSEKYEIRNRNWFAQGNIRDYIKQLNLVRNRLPPLQKLRNLVFLGSDNPNVLVYCRTGKGSTVLVAVNINPKETQRVNIQIPRELRNSGKEGTVTLMEHMTDAKLTFTESSISVSLAPGVNPGVVFTKV